MNKATATLTGFTTKISAAGSIVTASFGGMLKMFESTGSALNDMSMQTGIAVENLSFLKYAAEQSGAGVDAVVKASRELLTKGIDPNQFITIATAIAAIEDPTKRAQAAFEKFGTKAGFALLPMLQDLPALQERFNELGGTFTTKMAKAADALGDAFGDLKLALAGVGNEIAMQLAPMIQDLAEYIADNIGAVREWVGSHETLVKSVAIVAASLATVVPVLYGINTAVSVLTTSLKGMALVSAFLSKNPVVLGLLAAGALGYAGYKGYQYLTGPSSPPVSSGATSMPGLTPALATAGGGSAQTTDIQREQLRVLREIAKLTAEGGGDDIQLGTVGLR